MNTQKTKAGRPTNDDEAATGRIDTSKNMNASVPCQRCGKYFKLPQTLGTDPWPVQCLHCGYVHTSHDGDAAFWAIFENGKWTPRQKRFAKAKGLTPADAPMMDSGIFGDY